ncbi:MAG: hypothetical protein GX410_07420 [Elusimicrobia bacterium]|nr:hypothetical protein [Elusimicrobiota bacterium]
MTTGKNVSGSALVIAVMLSLVVIFLLTVGGQLIQTSKSESRIQQKVLTEADNVARAGLTDAIAWFKRQTQQPVRSGYPPIYYTYPDGAFYPRNNSDAYLSDTADENIGLVREYQLSTDGLKWGRYEVIRQQDTALYPVDVHAVHDITSQRIDGKNNGEGLVWYLESIGYVYRKRDSSKAYNVAPNEIVARVRASTEIRRLALNLPAEAALLVRNGGSGSTYNVKINDNGRVMGGTKTGAWRYTGLAPKTYDTGLIRGNPATASAMGQTNPNLDPTVQYVLGISTTDLKLLSDYLVTDTSALPAEMPDMALVYIDGNASFTSARKLNGSGILFVNGNLSISAGSNSLYSGLIYVTGTATIYDPVLISGSMVGYAGSTISRAAATDVAEIDYDSSILQSVRQRLCQYRENKSSLHVFIGVPGLE